MKLFIEKGIDTFDCADIYTGVEGLIGKFRSKYPDLFFYFPQILNNRRD